MVTFKAKSVFSDKWIEGDSLIKASDGYVIVKGEMQWYDGREWNSGDSDFDYIDIETLIIEK